MVMLSEAMSCTVPPPLPPGALPAPAPPMPPRATAESVVEPKAGPSVQ